MIDFLKKTPVDERHRRFGIGEFEEIDDFPMLWTWFEEDALLQKIMGKPRMHTDDDGYFLFQYQWDLLIERISLEYDKKLRDTDYHDTRTAILEFSRGTEHGGYRSAFSHLNDAILEKALIVYINVTYEESLRKNRKRFNPDRPDSILEHGLPDEKLEKLYHDVDWEEVSADSPTHIEINGKQVPYVVFENMPSKTDDPALLGPALDEVFVKARTLYGG
ncbi:MAG: hypothetical protein C0600_06145 [Ignavibacteria bacterium]|nr:MAG: hypothetical protein C0600_06145 [Ignavibacteria bacterium]